MRSKTGLMTTLTACFSAAALLFGADANFTRLPQPLQFFGRDLLDSAAVAVEGAVTAAGHDSVSVTLLKDGAFVQRQAQALEYGVGSAPFSFTVNIHAELAQYRVQVRADTVLLADRDSLLCGDAFLINGQSNSITRASYAGQSRWIRTFGNEASYADTGFYAAQAMTQDSRAAIGVWGMRLAEKLVDSFQVPIFILNGGVGGTTIEAHLRDTSYSSIYGRLFYRARKAGLRDRFKALFWHQGENNTDATYANYAANFLSLCSAWKADYPAIKYITLFQIRPGCGFDYQGPLREVQRTLPSMRDSLRIMATMGLPGHDGCHYSAEGYFAMAGWLFPLVARDYYGSTDTVGITPPNVLHAEYADEAGRTVAVEFDQPVIWPRDTLGLSLLGYFYFNGAGNLLDSARSDGHNGLVLFLKTPSVATSLTYLPDVGSYNGLCLRNSRGIGALTFSGFPIDSFGTTRVSDKIKIKRNAGFTLSPNPFNPSTTILLPQGETAAALRVYSAGGRVVADLSKQAAGAQRVEWNAASIPSGVYFIKFTSGLKTWEKKAVLIR